MVNDVVSDLFTRIRNAQRAGHHSVMVSKARIVLGVLEVLKREGFIDGHEELPGGELMVQLRYITRGRPVITTLRRISTSGRRVYSPKDKLPRVRSGLGVSIVSTSKGVLSDREARAQGVGGEVLGVVS